MKAQALLDHFDRVVEAPDAIARLRKFILDLAVRGKLVPQDRDDEPASALVRRIVANKARSRTIKSSHESTRITPVPENQTRFRIPPQWVWVSFGDITISRDGERIPVSREERSQRAKIFDYYGASGVIDAIDHFLFDKPLLLIGEDGANLINRSTPIAFIARGKYWVNNHAHVIDGCSEGFLRYLQLFINATDLKPYVTGTAQPKMNQSKMNSIPVALPPISEQTRIIAKVDELMALCDQLEAAQAERERRRDLVVRASLRRLSDPDEGNSVFCEDANFYVEHLGRLASRLEHVRGFRESILTLAVRGALVPQDETDEPVDTQLESNDHERQLTARKDRRADVDSQRLMLPEDRWSIPASWRWRALGDVVLFIDYRGKTPVKVQNGVRLITAKNVRKGLINLSPDEFLSEDEYRKWMTRGFPRAGDVLFTTEAPMGNAAVVTLSERFGLAQRVICFRPYGAIDARFLVLQILSGPFQTILNKAATGLTAKGIKAAKLKRLPLAVPPLAEQRRIVTTVDELATLCDQLESQISAANAGRRHLLEAVLHDALNDNSDPAITDDVATLAF